MEINRKPQPTQTESTAGTKKGAQAAAQESSTTTTNSRGVSETQDTLESALANGEVFAQSKTKGSDSPQTYEILKMIGADAVLTESEIEVAAKDSQKLKDLMNIVSNGQLLGSDDTSIAKAKQEYLRNPNSTTLNNELYKLVAESQNAPVEEAKAAGLTNPSDLLKLAADLALLGEENVGRKMSDVATYEQIKKNGVDSVLADTIRNSMSLPESTRGMSSKQLLDATSVAQQLGLDQTDSGFWAKVRRDGIAGVIADHRKTHGDGGNGPGGNSRKVVDEPYGRSLGKIIRSEESGPRSNRGKSVKSSVNPMNYPDASQQPNSTKQQDSAQSSSRNRSFSDNSVRERPSFTRAPGNKTAGGNATQTGGGSSPTQGDPNGPTQGTNSQGGAANVYGSGEGSAKQTGVGISAPTGTEAGSGAVVTAIGYERDNEGRITVTWSRSGGMDGQDGFYNTTYTQSSDGTWNYTVTDALTGEVVNTGTGDPPSEDIVGTSTQDVGDDGTIYFPTEDEEDESGDEGKPLPPGIGFDRPDVVRVGAWFMAHDIDKPVDYLPPELMNFRPSVISAGDAQPKNPGNVDPVDPELQQTRIGKSRMRRSEGYTDPVEPGSGGRPTKNPDDQPPGPSHAKRKRGSQGMHQQNMRRKGPAR